MCRSSRALAAADDFLVVAGRIGDELPHRPPGDGDGVAVHEIAELAQHGGQAARVVEIFHEEAARRHQVDEARDLTPEPVPVLERELDADPSRNRQQVNHRVGRSPDGVDGAHGVLERLAREHLRRLEILLHHRDDAVADKMSEPGSTRIDGGDRGVGR